MTTPRPLYEPFSTGANWLLRAVVMSALLHGVIVAVWYVGVHKAPEREKQLVDIELAPPPPKAEALTAESPEINSRKTRRTCECARLLSGIVRRRRRR